MATAKSRSESAKKAAETKRKNARKRSDSAKKGAETKRKNVRKRSDSAKKGAETRKKNAAKKTAETKKKKTAKARKINAVKKSAEIRKKNINSYDKDLSLSVYLHKYIENHYKTIYPQHMTFNEKEMLLKIINILEKDEKKEPKAKAVNQYFRDPATLQYKKEKTILMLESSISQNLIAKIVDVTEVTISSWKKKYLLSLFRKGVSAKKISNKYNVNLPKAREWRREALGMKKIVKKPTKPKKHRTKYTKKIEQESMKLIREGSTVAKVSDTLGVPKEIIRRWRKKSGLSPGSQKYTAIDENNVLDLLREKKSNLEISKLTGISPTTVAKWKKQFILEKSLRLN